MGKGRSRRRLGSALLAIAAVVLIGICAIVTTGNVNAQSATPAAADATPQPETGEPAPSGPIEVTVGFYINSIYGLDQQASTFNADFYLWMRWRGDVDPTLTLEMLNNIERWGLTMIPVFEEPMVLPDGQNLQQFHVQGQFSQSLALKDFPLDKHDLGIQIEDSTYLGDQLVYIPDLEQSGLSPSLRMAGWKIDGWDLTTPTHSYATGFGEPGSESQEYSTAKFTLSIERPISYFGWKLLLPLVIVLLLGVSVLLIHASFVEVRLAGPATALLTLVFLQQTYTSSLPESGNLVLLDKIYALAYVLVIGLIGTTLLTAHWLRLSEANIPRAERLDRYAAVVLFGIFIIGTAILVIPVL
jgi:hypothetical protein